MVLNDIVNEILVISKKFDDARDVLKISPIYIVCGQSVGMSELLREMESKLKINHFFLNSSDILELKILYNNKKLEFCEKSGFCFSSFYECMKHIELSNRAENLLVYMYIDISVLKTVDKTQWNNILQSMKWYKEKCLYIICTEQKTDEINTLFGDVCFYKLLEEKMTDDDYIKYFTDVLNRYNIEYDYAAVRDKIHQLLIRYSSVDMKQFELYVQKLIWLLGTSQTKESDSEIMFNYLDREELRPCIAEKKIGFKGGINNAPNI